ncbi:helix-turn-helix domain-containing protein [Desulfovibrio sp.]|uniref:helix-turn-helix domain-containing protein n=1 Tax=Desulfovibrio sp. TaxID=885 RepID=UPI00345BFC36
MRDEVDIYREISKILEQKRVNLGMSKRQLGKLAGITPVYLREVLRGERKPSVIILISLCSALNFKPSDLFLHLESKNKI